MSGMESLIEDDFKNFKMGDAVEVILNGGARVNGTVTENNLEQSYIQINEELTDTMVKYEQIKSVKIFN